MTDRLIINRELSVYGIAVQKAIFLIKLRHSNIRGLDIQQKFIPRDIEIRKWAMARSLRTGLAGSLCHLIARATARREFIWMTAVFIIDHVYKLLPDISST
jgi:hypothetical protein